MGILIVAFHSFVFRCRCAFFQNDHMPAFGCLSCFMNVFNVGPPEDGTKPQSKRKQLTHE